MFTRDCSIGFSGFSFIFFKRQISFCLAFFVFGFIRLYAVDATIILASVEGDVSSLSVKDEFTLTLDDSSVGKTIDSDSVLLTGKSGTASLLFSNGVLITVKPGSRFFLKKFSQKSFKDETKIKPSELEEEPSQSELLAHLDFGNLVVKAPKLKKGSSMLVTSPLGTAGIRGTMFQLVAVRNPLSGDITGGVNLISGDISFTDVGGREISLVSGQSLRLACGRLGESRASVPGGLVNLTATYQDSLVGGAIPPSIDMLFPGISVGGDADQGDDSSPSLASLNPSANMESDWEMVHEIASDIFFTIESTEVSSSSITFDSLTNAVPISVPEPQPQTPAVPMSVSGNEAVQLSEAIGNLYVNPPVITLTAGANQIYQNPLVIEYLVRNRNVNYPIPDHGPFQILPFPNNIHPSYKALTLGNIDITNNVQVSNVSAVDYSVLGQETQISLYVDDFEQRKIKYANGEPVSAIVKPVIKIIDNLKPLVSFADGNDKSTPYMVEGIPNGIFSDPGITVIDNYYTQNEITNFMNLADGLTSSSFGSVNMNLAGVYEITYQGITDPSGNVAESKTRWVEVYDNIAPDITLYGANPVYVDLNSSAQFKDSGVFATDNLDGTIEWGDSRIEVFVEVLLDESTSNYSPVADTLDSIISQAKTQYSVNSTYRLKYVVSDLAGNKSDVYRQFVLLNSPFKNPTMILHGDNPLIHEVNTEFSDPGVTAYKDMGTGLAPLNLNDRVNALSYLGGVLKSIDQTTVNYNHTTQKYVNATGQEDNNQKISIKYEVIDEFGNQASLDREVRIVDTTAPVITPNDDGGADLNNLQASVPYSDFGGIASDNYDDSSLQVSYIIQSMATNAELVDPSGGNYVDTLSDIGFWDPGQYKVLYSATDANGNTGSATRDITVIDTVAPYTALIPHSFLTSPSTNTLNSSAPSVTSIINSNYPIPSLISSALSSLSGYDHTNKTYDQTGPGSDPYINTFGSDTDFYIKDDVTTNTDVVFDDAVSTGKTTTSYIDSWGRSFIWHSAFKITFDNGVVLQDPGIYVRNDSSLSLTVTSSVDKSSVDGDGNRDVYKVTYTASQAGGQQAQLYQARSVHFLDTVAPQISLSPNTDGINSFILIEGGTTYGDDGSAHLWNNNTNTKESSSQTLSVSVVDASEGIIPNSLVRTVYSGIVNNLNVSSSTPIGESIYKTNPVDGSIQSDASIVSAVTSQISSSSYSDWNNTYTIKYDASDSLGNQATPVYRYLIVKDTESPAINNFYTTPLSDGDNSVVILNFNYSGSDYDISSEQSIKNFLISQLTASDTNNFTPSNDLTWIVEIEKTVGDGGTYDPLNPYPAIKSNNGYFVTINVKDTSGNASNTTSTIQLKVGDTTPPTLTMMGQSTIHDFLRFKSNSSLPTSNEEISDNDYNTTGFGGGEHRLLYHDYNFVDPGVYAEDANSYFNVSNHPDLDGDGVGEGYAMVKVGSISDASSCASGSGLIHVYSHFEENELSLNSSNFSEWQNTLDGSTLGDDNASIPAVWDSVTNNATDHNFTDSGKSNTLSIKVKTITLSYYVKDGWDNISNPLIRTVHFYQSAQYDGYAFYATPISNKDGGDFEDFYDNGSGNPFLTSVRKDTDGDGVSDYWEVALGTDPQNKSSLPDMTDQSVFQALSGVDPNTLKANFNKLNDASALSGVDGINGFSSTP